MSDVSPDSATRIQLHRNRRPLAYDVRDLIARNYIFNNAVPPGSRLPSEHTLSDRYGVSRVTVRAALHGLREAGLVAIRQGHGATVLPRPIAVTHGLDRLGSIDHFAREAGQKAGSADLDLEERPATQEEADRLHVPEGTPIMVVRRAKTFDGVRVAWLVDYVPEGIIDFDVLRPELDGSTLDDAVALSRRVAERIWSHLEVPVYYYEFSALVAEHRNLADLRRGQFERIRDEIATAPHRAPDLGDLRVHPTAGITAVGARAPLIAFNVLLDTDDVALARAIARAVRFSSGGIPAIKALGFEIRSRGRVQVSMNLVNYLQTPLHVAFEAVRREADARGVRILSTELIGLIPEDAMLSAATHYLQMEQFSRSRVLENRLEEAIAERDRS